MKTLFEEFVPDAGSSFRVMGDSRLSDVFYWHFHPEFELVYIEAERGPRHVGEHFSQYEGSDLVLIGSNIPHLNFDYGLKTSYEQMVLHIRADFLGEAFASTPELAGIYALFERSAYGITFGEQAKKRVGERLKKLAALAGFELFQEVLALLRLLADTTDYTLLHASPAKNQYNQKERDRLKRLYRFIDENYHRKIDVDEAAAFSNLTKAAFCRYFKKMTRQTFTEFLNQYRINQARRLLLLDHNVTEVCFACGFESLSYFNRTFKKITGENPLAFKKKHSVGIH
jgi:AraC-like DNA-binding protein